MSVNWFPGHMVKARREIKENLKLVDIIIEIVDARAPESTRNHELEEMFAGKPVLMVLNKKDMVQPDDINRWQNRLAKKGITAVGVNSTSGEGIQSVLKGIEKLYQPTAEAMTNKNWRVRPPRVMVVGIPNVGKSTFLNSIIKRKAARTGPQPGVTRGKQWVRVEGKIDLLDTPGLMWPKVEGKEQGLRLAALGVIGEKAYKNLDVARYIIRTVKEKNSEALKVRFKLNPEPEWDDSKWLEAVARRKGFLIDGEPDMERVALLILNEFRKGLIVKTAIED